MLAQARPPMINHLTSIVMTHIIPLLIIIQASHFYTVHVSMRTRLGSFHKIVLYYYDDTCKSCCHPWFVCHAYDCGMSLVLFSWIYMDCIKMACLYYNKMHSRANQALTSQQCRCNVFNDILRNHIAEHICELLSCRPHENISIPYIRYSSLVLIYLCVFYHYKSCLHNWAYTLKRVLLILQMHCDMHILFHQCFQI